MELLELIFGLGIIIMGLVITVIELNACRLAWRNKAAFDYTRAEHGVKSIIKLHNDVEAEKVKRDENCERMRKQNNVLTVLNKQLKDECSQHLAQQDVTAFFEGLEKLLPALNNNCKVTITRTDEKLAS